MKTMYDKEKPIILESRLENTSGVKVFDEGGSYKGFISARTRLGRIILGPDDKYFGLISQEGVIYRHDGNILSYKDPVQYLIDSFKLLDSEE